ncbi:MAG: signal peptidase II [Actinobacteria bacterium]|nr:signal peptidase II [Actinomycetota bacterium]MSW24969.1 signal peptidase II [Actinomycetota bacterium]MSX29187.1 signal peptidase II [Actinomycetota bacterium]MSX43461.1 signal peptidase II [Actinomycetota bacterium]MSX96572.1 signal peptidase II [Actinomycetota bacterium]
MLVHMVLVKTVASRSVNYDCRKQTRARQCVCLAVSVKTVPNVVYRRHLLLTALLVLLLDIATKVWAVAKLENQAEIPIIGEFLKLSFVRNPGAAFSFGTSVTWVFTLIAIAVSISILVLAKSVTNSAWAIALGGLLGGALGNLVDRIFRSPEVFHGHVVDFISLPNYPMFNISDSAVVLSSVAMVMLSIRGVEYRTPSAFSETNNSDPS